jgi:hypothetical protein
VLSLMNGLIPQLQQLRAVCVPPVVYLLGQSDPSHVRKPPG